jgi:hypothetical protein
VQTNSKFNPEINESSMDQLAALLKYGRCESCNKHFSSTTLHTCPYKEDIDGDYNTLCNCCDVCLGNCTDDI